MMIEQRKEAKTVKIKWFAFLLLLGICFWVFYTVVHPLYIYDTDDWTYISYSRHAWPTTKEWNPTKILPETLMPLIAEIGVRGIMPFGGGYISSIAMAFAGVLVLFILMYTYQFGRAIKQMFGIKIEGIFLILLLFLLSHFLPFNVNNENNYYLLYGGNVNCMFNYLLPGLINATAVMYLTVNNQHTIFKKSPIILGLLVVVGYLCLYSNMFHSIILAAFAGTNILFSLIKNFGNRNKDKKLSFLKTLIKNNILWFLIDAIWGVGLFFEVNGGRAARTSNGFLALPIGETFKNFIGSIMRLNKIYVLFILFCVCLGLTVFLYTAHREKDCLKKIDLEYIYNILRLVVSLTVTVIYLILLCAKVSPVYMENNLVEFTWMFWVMMLAFLSLAYALAKIPRAFVCLPLILYIFTFETVIDGKSYAENNVAGFSASTVKALDENIIRQIVEAEENEMSDVMVSIPVHESEEWPMNLEYGGSRIATSLFRHGIIDREIEVILVMDPAVNEEFHLD